MLAFSNSHSQAGPLARKQPRQRRSRETVAAILEAATRIFEVRGYERATTNQVAERAGVSIGSLYQYFPHKAALASALEEHHVAEVGPGLVRLARELRTAGATPVIWSRRLVHALVAANDRPIHRAIWGVAPRSKALQQTLERLVDTIAAELVPLLHGRDRALRAQTAVVAAITLVHELVMPASQRRRPRVREEVSTMLRAYLDPSAG